MLSMRDMTGQELRDKRVAAGVKSWEVGAEMRVASSRISQLEAQASVTDDSAARYLAALDKCLVAKTSAASPEAVA